MKKERLGAISKRIETKDDPGYAGVRGSNIFTSDFETWKPKEGENSINIIPPHDDERYFGMKVFVHYRVGSGGDHFLCPKANDGGRCPICEYQSHLISNLPPDNDGYTTAIKKLFPTARMVYMIVDTFNEKEIEKGIQIYCAAYDQVDAKGIVPLCQPRRGEGGPRDISDPELALDIIFTREGKDKENTRYFGFATEESRIHSKEFFEELPEKFEDILNYADYDTIAEAFNSQETSTKDEEEPKATRTRTRTPREEAPKEEAPKEEAPKEEEAPPSGDDKAAIRKRLRSKIKNEAD